MELKYGDNVIDSIKREEVTYKVKDTIAAAAIEELNTAVEALSEVTIEGNALVISEGTSSGGGVVKYEFIDMGLSVDWATCNIGATKPEEYGWYFQWAGTTPYNSDRTPVDGGDAINFNFNSDCPYWVSGTNPYNNDIKWSKYNTSSSHGTVDNKNILENEDDAAYIYIGDHYRMPTKEEYDELIDACDTEWVENYNNTGIKGKLFKLKSDSSKALFFPAAGFLDGTRLSDESSYVNYWSSSLETTRMFDAYYLRSDLYNCNMNYWARYYGFPIRAVRHKQNVGGDLNDNENTLNFKTSGNNPIQSVDDLQGYTIYLLNGNTIEDALEHLYMDLGNSKFKLIELGSNLNNGNIYGFSTGPENRIWYFVTKYDEEKNTLIYWDAGDSGPSNFIGNTILWE